MKNNKKVLIPLFATVAGLSIVGGVGGAVAWYQYNTRANASFVGSSVAKSGVLQISRDNQNWHRDVYYKQDDPSFVQDFAPVTFGSDDDNHIQKNEVLPRNNGAKAYTQPEAGVGAYDQWKSVDAGTDYIQFKIYLKALDLNTKPDVDPADDSQYKAGVHDVYLTELILDGKKQMNNDDANPEYNEEIGKALRIHLDVKGGKKFLISQNGSSVALGDNLDLDGVDGLDRVSNWAWDEGQPPLVNYGNKNAVEDSYSVADVKATKDANGDIDLGTSQEEIDANKAKKLICTTSASESVEITVTCWLEGWEKLEGKDKYEKASPTQAEVEADIAREEEQKEYFIKDGSSYVRPQAYDDQAEYFVRKPASAIWDPRVTATHQDSQDKYLSQLRVGMTFDVGKSAFKA